MEGKPASAGKTRSNKESSNTEAALQVIALKAPPKVAFCDTNSHSYLYSPQPNPQKIITKKLIYARSVNNNQHKTISS